jgi:outer membrane protein OmpA-like peptidoglycan-associated protein
MGMGSAVVAVSQGSSSLLWNPAGLSRMTCAEVGFHTTAGLGNLFQGIAIVGTPLGDVTPDGKGGSMGGIAASLGYVSYGNFDGRDAVGLPNGSYNASEFSGSIGWGMELLPNFSGGVVIKGDQQNLAGNNYDAVAADLGVLWTILPRLDLGVTYSNISLGNTFNNPLAAGWRLGAAWSVDKRLIIAGSTELQATGVNRLQLGTEYLFGNLEKGRNVLALRFGYQANYPDPQLTGLTGLTLGLGYTITRSMILDYAMVPSGDLGISHRLSLGFKFNCWEKPQPPAAAPMAQAEPTPEPVVAPVEAPPIVVKSILLEDSHFDFDKSTLRPEGMQALRDNIQLLKDNPTAKVRIAGYTSKLGTAEYNQALSERRATAVEGYLISQGIAPSRITTIGYGATHPATFENKPSDSNSPAAKSNMRVLFETTVK